MNKHTPVIINGVAYDAKTGMQISDYVAGKVPEVKQPAVQAHPQKPAHNLHPRTHRSQTLRRDHVKSPVKPSISQPIKKPIQRSAAISRFATDVKPVKKPTVDSMRPQAPRASTDIAPVRHHAQELTRKHHTAVPAPVAPVPARELKHQAISQALEKSTSEGKKAPKRKWQPKTVSIVSASFAVALLAGYFTYLSLPNISVRVAAAQSGIAATYPSYHPQGYRLNGPVAYTDGEVKIQFDSNTNDENFTVSQTKSSWDSSALLANYVEPAADDDYITYNDSGLTIYIYDKGAAWVSNGVLHTIEGNASLSNDQVRRMATSM